MAKKFVRGVTGVDDIESFDKTLTNVNDLISDGQNTYVHTKKGKVESYYNLTENLKAITSDNSDLITVTKDDTTNTATIHPKHDAQKEQSLESIRGTVSIQKGGNGTSETTKLDTNPQKVLEHDNLLTDYGIRKNTTGNTTKLSLEYTQVNDGFNLNTFSNGRVLGTKFVNSPKDNTWFYVTSYTTNSVTYQEAVGMFENNIKYVRTRNSSVWSSWREQVGDKSVIDALLANKQDKLYSSISIGVSNGQWLRRLYLKAYTYNSSNGLLKTRVKSIANNTTPDNAEEEFNFTVKINQNAQNVVFTLNEDDKTSFTKIMSNYGSNNTVRISGCVFTLSGSTLSVSTTSNTAQNYVITFSDII